MAHLEGLPETTPVEIWFEDEARIGQKNGQVRQWARRGTRPRQPADQRSDNAYLFGAICPARGVGAALALPYADTDMMQLHLDEISRNVTAGAHAVLLFDRAGWHTTGKLDLPDNITPIFLPSRAPELNPKRSSPSECETGLTSVRCYDAWYWRAALATATGSPNEVRAHRVIPNNAKQRAGEPGSPPGLIGLIKPRSHVNIS
jgi:DDE superfamily endonuclease